jgi:hypothetical protein
MISLSFRISASVRLAFTGGFSALLVLIAFDLVLVVLDFCVGCHEAQVSHGVGCRPRSVDGGDAIV